MLNSAFTILSNPNTKRKYDEVSGFTEKKDEKKSGGWESNNKEADFTRSNSSIDITLNQSKEKFKNAKK